MSDPTAADGASESVEAHVESVTVRRAPRFSVFFVLGGAVGLLAAMILTFSFDGSEGVSPLTGLVYSPLQVFGFLALILVPAGVAIAALVALAFDRRSGRHVRAVTVDRETHRVD